MSITKTRFPFFYRVGEASLANADFSCSGTWGLTLVLRVVLENSIWEDSRCETIIQCDVCDHQPWSCPCLTGHSAMVFGLG